jgi:hypothetical protein
MTHSPTVNRDWPYAYAASTNSFFQSRRRSHARLSKSDARVRNTSKIPLRDAQHHPIAAQWHMRLQNHCAPPGNGLRNGENTAHGQFETIITFHRLIQY